MNTGGGSATSGGVDFQSRIAAWVAVSILAGEEASSPWSLPENVRLNALWSETGQPVDDLLIATSAGGFAFLQAKRRLDLSRRADSDFASALDQCVRQYLTSSPSRGEGKPWERPLDPARDRVVIVTGKDSSEPIRIQLPILLGRLAVAPPEHSLEVAANAAERQVLEVLLERITESWSRQCGYKPPDSEIVRFARLLNIQILDVEAEGVGEAQAKDRLRHLLANPDHAAAAWGTLVGSALQWSKYRTGAHRASLEEILDRVALPLRNTAPGRPALGATTLSMISRATLSGQIQSLSQGKYDRRLFVPRRDLSKIETFLDTEILFQAEAARRLDRLRSIALMFNLDSSGVDSLLHRGPELRSVEAALPALKEIFHFATIERILSRTRSMIREPLDSVFERELYKIRLDLEALPFTRAKLSEAINYLYQLRREALIGGQPRLHVFLSLFPGEAHETSPVLANSLLAELEQLVRRHASPCLALVGRAGHGKTNLLCYLAEELVCQGPVVLLSGQMSIADEYGLETHLKRWLERGLGYECKDWPERVAEGLETAKTSLFVLIDAINETPDPLRMSLALEQFATLCRGRHIKILLSCRDILWPVFDRRLRPHLFGGEPVILPEYTAEEERQARELYFSNFSLNCRVGPEAELLLRNPLLLSLFCRSNVGRDLGAVMDLRVVDVFDQSISHAAARIAERSALTNTAIVEHILQKIGTEMWRQRRTVIHPSEVGISPQEQSDPLSVYNQLRSEGILFEAPGDDLDSPVETTLNRPFQFLYEAFAEYVIAYAWRLTQGHSGPDEERQLLNEALGALSGFPAALGALLFLDRMQGGKGELAQEAILAMSERGDSFLLSNQGAVSALFEALPVESAEDETIRTLVRFEALADPASKEALAPVVLRFLKHRRGSQELRELAFRLLEIPPDLLSFRRHPSNPHSSTPLDHTEVEVEGPVGALPPARHHYSQETRLTALSLLVSAEPDAPVNLFLEGTRKLGSLDLNSALEAFRFLDRASDQVIFAIIEQQIEVQAPEYRIYCAWLLRNRYGEKPAEYLVRLLTDPQTRVHRYAFSLFRARRVEVELVDAILACLADHENTPSWHLVHLLDLLARPERFHPASLANTHAKRIRTALRRASAHLSSSVRRIAFQGLISLCPPADLAILREQVAEDQSPTVRELAREFAS